MTYYSITNVETEGVERINANGPLSDPTTLTTKMYAHDPAREQYLEIGRDCFETRAEAEAAAVKKLDGMIADADRRVEKLRKVRMSLTNASIERYLKERL